MQPRAAHPAFRIVIPSYRVAVALHDARVICPGVELARFQSTGVGCQSVVQYPRTEVKQETTARTQEVFGKKGKEDRGLIWYYNSRAGVSLRGDKCKCTV